MAVAIAVFFLILLPVLALVLDAGLVYEERRELQNGADAAVLAVAHSCARGSCDPALADEYTTANAITDGAANVHTLTVDTGAGEVHSITESEDPDGNLSMSLRFAQLFGMDATTVYARATARWGSLATASTIPWIISYCDLDKALEDQGGYRAMPPYPSPGEVGAIITFHDTQTDVEDLEEDERCDRHPGFDEDGDEFLPGGFGKLQVDENCRVTTYTEGGEVWAPVQTGVSAPPSHRCLAINTVVTIPIFVDFRIVAGSDEYRIGGYAAFYLTGYRMPGYAANPPCGGSETCISGFFTQSAVSDGEFGGEDFGVSLVKLTG
ncbi:MAG TPA: pilus assembly protein TadG-related protein [Egibacteraceae bacterium]|nr:pilus assembly protein TadG-related protein [Egibacteraceae bacterium]